MSRGRFLRRTGAPPRRASALIVLLVAALTALALTSRRAHAYAEQFSSFEVEAQDQDDETAMDHMMARLPIQWRDEWERSPQAFRTSQGCHTSGEWFQLTDLKLETPLGRDARFGVMFTQRVDNVASFEDLALAFRFPVRAGRLSVEFHPASDKSRQDYALTWDTGADTSALHVRVTFMIEDMLNNLWQQRQARVGHLSEPYLRHPYLGDFEFISRHDHWRIEGGGRYLTPSTKQVLGLEVFLPPRVVTLWGALGWAAAETEMMGFQLEGRGENQQALSTDQPLDYSSEDHHEFRRQWTGEGAISRALAPRTRLELRWLYESRTEDYGAGIGPGRFDALDRITQLGISRDLHPGWRLGAGALYDRVAFARSGITPWWSEARRKESRVFVSLQARFGRVSVEGIESLDLDTEPYEVTWHHDKGFLRLQGTF